MLAREDALRVVNRLYAELQSRRPEVEEYDQFYEGEQPLKFASREWAEFHKDRYTGFADNWCGVVPDASGERLRVTGINMGEDHDSTVKRLWGAMERAGFAAQSSQGFLQSMIAKRSFVLVWGDKNERPVLSWEHPSQVIVEHDAETGLVRRFALKAWVDGKTEFATLYTPSEVWKFQREALSVKVSKGRTEGGLLVPTAVSANAAGTGWEPRQPSTDDTWPIKNPLGEVPIVEIPNRPRLKRGPISDIHGTIAMQNAINLLWAFLFSAADHASMPARVVLGAERPKVPVLDSDGQQIGTKDLDLKELQHGRLMWLTGQDAKIGQWDAARLDVFTNVIEVAIGHIGAQTRTPAHYFVANKGLSNVNGETLTATETPLVKKCEEFQLYSSGPLATVAGLVAKVMNEPGLGDALLPSSIRWANPGIRSEAQLADALLKRKQIGYPLAWLLEQEGLSPSEIDRVLEMREKERFDPMMADLADRLVSGGDY